MRIAHAHGRGHDRARLHVLISTPRLTSAGYETQVLSRTSNFVGNHMTQVRREMLCAS